MDAVIRTGEVEPFKAGVHLALFGLSVACFFYSAMAMTQRPHSHLMVNVGAYAALTAFEWKQIMRHL